ncbi:hypothetical protein MCP1_120069 [Candidatus Terasakiella magnetica]|nr:hypothetical protein MCP1_120069 [Candidatus Terasakiella magnetica]
MILAGLNQDFAKHYGSVCGYAPIPGLMIIVHDRGGFLQPYRHPHKDEFLLVLEGEALAVFFDDVGALRDVIVLGASGSGKHFYNRRSAGVWHTLGNSERYFHFYENYSGDIQPGG